MANPTQRFPGSAPTFLPLRPATVTHIPPELASRLPWAVHGSQPINVKAAFTCPRSRRLHPVRHSKTRGAFPFEGFCRNIFTIFITAITYNITIDADLYSSRVTSRGLFKENSDRYLQKDAIVGPGQTCSEFTIHIQVWVPSSLPPSLPGA